MRLFSLTQPRLRLRRRWWIASGCVVMLLFILVGENGYWSRRERREQIEGLRTEINSLQQENQQLTQRIQALRSDPHAIEKMAREQLRLARPGEVIIALPRADPGEASADMARSNN